MGKITDQLLSLVEKQVRDKGIVVWYDPDRAYTRIAPDLSLPDATVLCYQNGFFELRERLEPFLEFVNGTGHPKADAGTPPKLLVYVPRERTETPYALIEAESAGVVIEPGANPWQRNTRLKVIAERVFKEIAPESAGEIGRQVDQGSLTLEDLDRLAEETIRIGSGAVKLIFETASVPDVALMFAASVDHDAAIQQKRAEPELAHLLASGLGIQLDPGAPLMAVRQALRRALLLSDFVRAVGGQGSDVRELEGASIPRSERHLDAAARVCVTWRNRSDLRESYVEAARAVEAEAGVAGYGLEPRFLVDVESFPRAEQRLLLYAEESILAGDPHAALDLASRRKQSFWSIEEPTNQLRWSLLETAGRLLEMGERIKVELRAVRKSPAAMVEAYAEGAEPWCLLDTCHRHLERQYTTFDLEIGGEHDRLEQVISRARHQYTEVIRLCAEAFCAALEAADFHVEGVLRQDQIFSTLVEPRMGPARVAYILVDALRFEMGRELLEGLGVPYQTRLLPAIAQLPSITEVGMSALLPGADRGLELVEAGAGKIAIRIGPTVVKDRKTRIEYLRQAVGGEIVALKLNDLGKPTRKLRDDIQSADLVLVTSQEIDQHGEGAEDEDEARRYMNEVLDKLRKGIRRLASLGVSHFIVTADHGHLFGEAVESGMKMDAPGGRTADLHRRVWIGRGGSAADGYLRIPASRIGLGGEPELAFPRSLACFRVKGGSNSYFHGGASLQEIVIPVAVVEANPEVTVTASPAVIRLVMERPRITTRFFSVSVTYIKGLFGAEEKRVRLVARANKKEIGAAVAAAYGFEESTQEIILQQERPNAVTLMLMEETDAKTVSVHALDAATQVELEHLDDVAVSIAL